MKATEEEAKKAVHIAAVIMQADGLCRYDSYEKCRRLYTTAKACTECIEKWLIGKARREIQGRKKRDNT